MLFISASRITLIGVTASKEQLKVWVDYALENHSLILSIRHMKHLLQMILQNRFMKLRALRNVLLSFVRSLKQPALQVCAAAIPLFLRNLFFDGTSLNPLWARRQATKFNGVSYVTQRAAEAVYSEEGRKQTKRGYCVLSEKCKNNFDGLTEAGFICYGAKNSPYVWLSTPDGMTSWEFFDDLLDKCQVVGTPGSGFGPSGEGYLRLTAFGNYEKTIEAVERIKSVYGK